MKPSDARSGNRSCPGFSLVEVMISLAISAMLLAAVAAAFSASTAAVENNDQFFRASQSARVALNLMLTEIRRCNAVNVPSATRIDMITADLQDLSFVYTYDSTRQTGKLMLIKNDTGAQYTLADHVAAMTFANDTALGAGNVTYVARVAIAMNVENKDNQVRLAGSAAPRRVLVYKS